MAIPTTTVVGLGCSTCGYVDVYRVSVFLVNAHQSIAITCNCGKNLLNLSAREHKRVCVQVQCPFCEQPHSFLLNRSQVWGRKVIPLYCRATGQEIGRLGPEPEVTAGLNLDLKRTNLTTGMLPLSIFSEHSLALYDVMDRIIQMAEEEKIHCPCSQLDLEVEIFPDKIRLYCESCGAWSIVQIRSEGEGKGLPDQEKIRLNRVDRGSDFEGAGGRSSQTRNKRNI